MFFRMLMLNENCKTAWSTFLDRMPDFTLLRLQQALLARAIQRPFASEDHINLARLA